SPSQVVTSETVIIPTSPTSDEPILTQTTNPVTVISGTIYTIGPDGTPIPGGINGGNNGSSKAGLSGGATAGVVVGSLVMLALVAGVFFVVFRRQSRRLQNPNARFVAAGTGAADAGNNLHHLYGSRQPEGSGSHGSHASVRHLAGGAPAAGHIVVAPEMSEHPANRSNMNLHSGPMAFGTSAALGASVGFAGAHVHDGYHESGSEGREGMSSYGASGGGSAPGGISASGGDGSNLIPYNSASGSTPQSAPSGGSGSPQSQKGSIHYI
ncbi:hypothetical protein BGW38_000973, partial [Lunasporangiospora selenospora]